MTDAPGGAVKVPLPYVITGTGSRLPVRELSNDAVAAHFGRSGGWIEEKTGVRSRRVAAVGESVVELAAGASLDALADAGVPPGRLALVVAASSTPGRFVPGIACGVQRLLGARTATALDVNAACAGFCFAVHTALGLLAGGLAEGPVLVVGAECFSPHLDYTDRATAALFGDGAGAVVIEAAPAPYGFLHTGIGSAGDKEQYVRIVPGEGRSRDAYTLFMDGRATREFIEERLPAMLSEALAAGGLRPSDLDLVVPHQANPRLLHTVLEGAGLEPEQIFMTGQRYGNTGAASVPVTLDAARRAGRLHDGALVALAALGAGMTWGTQVLRWRRPDAPSVPGPSASSRVRLEPVRSEPR
ncbi:ketoacyl-ACP synthase III [Streptomyces sp. NPDC050508]|uniref:3-oxoacyl-ACP synthase III family protein n=1 Tax=Streptomyces sp. NPDC050508 TaxID=3155405 RepID=UPI003441B105